MDIDNNELDKNVCVILETEYLNKYHELPVEWYQLDDYKLKNEIISKAINNNLKVTEIEEYKKLYRKVMKKNQL